MLDGVLGSVLRAPSAGFTQGNECLVLDDAEAAAWFWDTIEDPTNARPARRTPPLTALRASSARRPTPVDDVPETDAVAMDERGPSIQQRLYPDLPCFGCGPSNSKGLRLRSFPADDGSSVMATFTPWPEHDNGLGFLNGGIIGTVLDCHSAAAVMLEAERQGWPPLPGAELAYVTAGLDVRYRRPAPLHEPVLLRAVVTEAGEGEMTAEVELLHDDKVRAVARAVWKRWRPRPA